MRGRDIRGLVAPNRPGSKDELKEQESDPPDRQSPQRRDSARVSPNPQTENEHCDGDNQREEAMRHLQPNLKRGHVGITTRVAPGIQLCKHVWAGVRNPGAVCRWKIEDGEVAMLMAHGRAERELRVNRNCCCERERSERRNFF